ncbi:hypothetical protein A3709_19555 [Halioglobus sp. HI00S01]|uniref:hypothetical protein n=1 Tax=Halioglobus sp. HI00S01 TaxID=1822214 RepID=UPI0007C3DB67|nr:hypothetical protein [Halioglobus sp. HI00S01]KZX57822.1 hypothetical protein A3709_19555 [Halioglobus sp. HI00S01]
MRFNEQIQTVARGNEAAMMFGFEATQRAVSLGRTGGDFWVGVDQVTRDIRDGLVGLGLMSDEERKLLDVMDCMPWDDSEKAAFTEMLSL